MEKTLVEYDSIIDICLDIFTKKLKDYGSAWRILRISSLTDQIFIKAQRIRSIELKGIQKVDEGIEKEFIGIVNYAVIGLTQIKLGISDSIDDVKNEEAINLFKSITSEAKNLMIAKNHDYGEAWRDMRISSLTDLILQKLLRVKKIEDNGNFTESVFVNGSNAKVKFFNKGPDNNWQNTLPKNIQIELENELKNELTELGYL